MEDLRGAVPEAHTRCCRPALAVENARHGGTPTRLFYTTSER